MKVLVISHMYPCTANEVGGTFVHDQVRALASMGVEMRVVSPRAWTPWPAPHLSPKWKAMSRVPAYAERDGISVLYPRYPAFPRGWMFSSSGRRMHYGIRSCVRRLHREFPFDLIHAHVALPDGYAGAVLAQEFQVPLVVTIHGQDLQQTVHRGVRCRRSLAFAFAHASRVVVVSQKLKQLADRHFRAGEKTRVIANGVDPAQVVMGDDVTPGSPGRGTSVLSVSNLIHSKGVDLNLAAVRRLHSKHPSLQYRVVGAGPRERELRHMASSLSLTDRVEFLGRQSHRHVMELMSQCDIFSLPSWNEGFGVVYLEAMAHGKPVIGCQGEGIEDFVEHGKTGLLVKPRDLDSLVEALDYLLSHPEEAKAMGERAREVVLENYTWEKNAEKTVQIYREVLDER